MSISHKNRLIAVILKISQLDVKGGYMRTVSPHVTREKDHVCGLVQAPQHEHFLLSQGEEDVQRPDVLNETQEVYPYIHEL